MELTADLFVTVDGYAAGEGVGAFFDYPGPDLDRWVRDALDQPHLVVMGRVTYEALAAISSGFGSRCSRSSWDSTAANRFRPATPGPASS